MATVDFYEKPGCINNTRQKQLLRQAGHIVVEHDLLVTRWTPEALMEFFSAMPVAEWFNSSAPQVKSGEVVPGECTVEQALALLIDTPLLIRRPLMRVGREVMVGLEQDAVDRWIGLQSKTVDDLETCPRRSRVTASVTDIKSRCV